LLQRCSARHMIGMDVRFQQPLDREAIAVDVADDRVKRAWVGHAGCGIDSESAVDHGTLAGRAVGDDVANRTRLSFVEARDIDRHLVLSRFSVRDLSHGEALVNANGTVVVSIAHALDGATTRIAAYKTGRCFGVALRCHGSKRWPSEIARAALTTDVSVALVESSLAHEAPMA
jgi:hypothetical protein